MNVSNGNMLHNQEGKGRCELEGIFGIFGQGLALVLAGRVFSHMNHTPEDAKLFTALTLDFVSEELPLCGEMRWVNHSRGQDVTVSGPDGLCSCLVSLGSVTWGCVHAEDMLAW